MSDDKPSNKLAKRFFDIDSGDSKLSSKSVVLNDDEKLLTGLSRLTSNISTGRRVDDGVTGVREALIYESHAFKGVKNIPDARIAGVIKAADAMKEETRDLEDIGVVIHYGVAAGGSLALMDPDIVPFTMLSRFYEIFDKVSEAQENTFRSQQIARVEFKGPNFGFIESFLDDNETSKSKNKKPKTKKGAGPRDAFKKKNPNDPADAGKPPGRGGIARRAGEYPTADEDVYPNSNMKYYKQVPYRSRAPHRFSYDLIVFHDGGYGWRDSDGGVKGFVHQVKGGSVGSHYYVTKDGTVYALAPEAHAAAHSGGDNDEPWNPNSINMRSIGIDLQCNLDTRRGSGFDGRKTNQAIYSEAQYTALSSLLKDICERRAIPLDNNHITGHWQNQYNRVDFSFDFDFTKLGLGLENPLGNDHWQRTVASDVAAKYKSQSVELNKAVFTSRVRKKGWDKAAFAADDYVFLPIGNRYRPFIHVDKTKK